MQEILGRHVLKRDMEERTILLGSNKVVFGSEGTAFRYRRYDGSALVSDSLIVTDSRETHLGIFPNPPTRVPREVAKNVYIKFKSPVIVDHKSVAVLYSKIPIEIGVYRQHKDEELLIDVFSLTPPRYALYGTPEAGVVCRYVEADAATEESALEVKQYEEAKVRIRITNDINNVIRVSRIIIPIDDVVLEHRNDDAWVPGSVEMQLDSAFGKDVVSVRLMDTRVKRIDKTSAKKTEDTLIFSMDGGY
ncbi:DUF432 domain-containing protein [Nitrososphaera sp.]|uniref:DUF432 domain-containing protein n=1 Tax=Nitrososphaera sp. TaxID=1971748 RepID=UPI0031778B26